MINQIDKELIRLENIKNIKIIYAVESGSRAWGFASKDSDWDVRFIYIHRPEWYLSIDEQKDSIEELLPNLIDLSGWDIQKTLKLFRKSNPPLLEWLKSPLVYKEQYSIIEKIRKLSELYFNPKSCIYHYLHMAEGNYREYLKSDLVRIKKYFYVLRPILACKWIEQTNSMAPMEFRKLLDTQVVDIEIKSEIEKLLERKISGDELDKEPKINILNKFLEEKIQYYKNLVKLINTTNTTDTDQLNNLFIESINEVWKVKF